MSILKKLQKLLRKYRGFMAIGIMFIAIVTLISLGFSYIGVMTNDLVKPDSIQENTIDDGIAKPFTLVMKTHYICGTQTESVSFENAREMDRWISSQQEKWKLESEVDNQTVMVREVLTDLSPLCKDEGYFGLSNEGVLTLFQGPPIENKVIQTFFRIDTRRLESKIPGEEIGILRMGIRIKSVDQYWSVLSTYGEFATEF
jgi:forespore regulator of the sigma-K checkpoint